MKTTYNTFVKMYLACLFFVLGFSANIANAGAPITKFSLTPDRAIQAPLDGATIQENIYVFVPDLKLVEWQLHWNPNVGEVTGYYIHNHEPVKAGPGVTGLGTTIKRFGPDILMDDPLRNKKIESVEDSGVFDKDVVYYKFYSVDIPLLPGERVCFRLTAYVDFATGGISESGYSEAACNTEPTVTDVVFYLDDPEMKGAPLHREMKAPWDMLGSDADGTALPLDVESLFPGEHVITSVTNYATTDGVQSNKQDARFTVVKKLPQNPSLPIIKYIMIHED